MLKVKYRVFGYLVCLTAFLVPCNLVYAAQSNNKLVKSYPTKSIGIEKSRLLSRLYDELRFARSNENALSIERVIENVWLESGSYTVDLLMARAIVAQKQRKHKLCVNILNQVVRLAPKYTEGWNRRAMIHFENNDYRLALLDIRKVLILDNNNFHAINGLGLILLEVGRKKAALKAFRKLLAIHPYYSDVRKTVDRLSREIEGQDL